ncbi:MAG: dNTP triphosphohydrolase [Candidatus Margulisiibacteriota bacterium]|jgi:dGTPase
MERESFEELEVQLFCPIAVKSKFSLGRQYPEIEAANRTCFQKDCDRIIHAKSFRRLKQKTQVFLAAEHDHYRSRLTHTLEVSYIARHLARLLRLNEALSEAIALAHDLGHTPFGHAGEEKLNELMSVFGGFEHNEQSLRIVDELEVKFSDFPGLNLTYEVRQGLLKKAKVHYVTLEAQIVDLADAIAYNTHDLEDGLSSGILVESDLTQKVLLWKEAKDYILSQYQNLEEEQLIHLITSFLISSQITDVFNNSVKNIAQYHIDSLSCLQKIKEKVVCFSSKMSEQNQELRQYLFANFYSDKKIVSQMKKGQEIIEAIFSYYLSNPNLMPSDFYEKIKDQASLYRVVTDYVQGMTDTYAEKVFLSFGSAADNFLFRA